MKLKFLAVVLLAVFSTSILALSQNVPIAPKKVLLPEGTELTLRMAQDISSRAARPGEPIELTLAEDLKVGDVVVAKAGARALGEVVQGRRPDFWGEAGEVSLRVHFLRVGDQKVEIRGALGSAGTRYIVIRGSQAVIKTGTLVKAFIAADVEVTPLSEGAGSGPSTTPESHSPSATLNEPILPGREASDSADKIRLANGKLLRLLLTEPLSSKTAKVGDPVKLQVLDEVKVGDLVVISAKAPASGTITGVKPAGRRWREGGVAIRLDSVTLVNQQEQAIEAEAASMGGPTYAASEWAQAIHDSGGWAFFFLPLAPLQHGSQATLRRGTVLEAFTHGEAWLDRASIEASQPTPPAKKSGPGSVTLYYPITEQGYTREIWCGAVKLGRLNQGWKFTIMLPPGRYWFRTAKKGTGTPLDVETGGVYYLRVDFVPSRAPPSARARSFPTVVEHDVGEIEASDARPAKRKDVQDVAAMDLALIQAESPGKK